MILVKWRRGFVKALNKPENICMIKLNETIKNLETFGDNIPYQPHKAYIILVPGQVHPRQGGWRPRTNGKAPKSR